MRGTCKGITLNGSRCQRASTSTGYCTTHNPNKRKLTAQPRIAAQGPKHRLQEVIETVLSTAKAKGWKAYVHHRDDERHRYATMVLSRTFDMFQEVVAELELDVTEAGVKTQLSKTSYNSHGLDTLKTAITESLLALPWYPKPVMKPQRVDSAVVRILPTLDDMLRRFDRFARQLNRRHAERSGIAVNDEYDVQDLLHALLRSITDDVRAEEVSPSYAGASSRVDFLLKKEKIVVEAKFASKSLRDRQVGEQLIVDIKRYSTHPDCKLLLCLVYDPGSFIKNPQGLESDLTGEHGSIVAKVFVVPH